MSERPAQPGLSCRWVPTSNPTATCLSPSASYAQFGRVRCRLRVWESAPFGVTQVSESPAANFLNGAVLLETELSAQAICEEAVPQIERTFGPRSRSARQKRAANDRHRFIVVQRRGADDRASRRFPIPIS